MNKRSEMYRQTDINSENRDITRGAKDLSLERFPTQNDTCELGK